MKAADDPSRLIEPYPSENFANVVAAVRTLDHPREIGPYQVISVIGEGGMGTVYKAQQTQPIRRTVAVKVIKLGMDTREVIARFESERQALAMMNHPNVARVLDAGATETGRPYFVMEYVDGEPINTFADRRQLTVHDRLELFTQACEAVQHAHQKAIIHRDLKPSNILVMQDDAGPRVKVIDFGVAKAIDQRLTEKSLFTELGRFVGTPEYMSPEQARAGGQDPDTRSDVYSLGVVLYELLSGVLPFDGKSLRSAGYDEIQRIIREVDPPRPSTRLSSLGHGAQEVARCRQLPLTSLTSQLKNELELIPLKAMRKERAHRYTTAAEMAQDIANYLASRPLIAGPESRTYRTRKFLRRNLRSVAVLGLLAAVLVAGIIATTSQAVRATRAERMALAQKAEAERQRALAESAAENVKEVNQFLTEDLLASAAPEVSRGREITVREAVDRAAETVVDRFKTRPATQAAVHAILADVYDSLGQYERAMSHAQSAATIRAKALGADDRATLDASRVVGRQLTRLNRYVEAESLLQDVVARCDRRLGSQDEVTLSAIVDLAGVLRRQRKFVEAEPLYQRVVAADRVRYGPQSQELANSLNNFAVMLADSGNDDAAEPLYREALAIRRQEGADHPYYLTSLRNVALLVQRRGRLAESEAMMLEALNGRRTVLGEDHPLTLLVLNDMAGILAEEKRYAEAEAVNRDALARRTRVLGEDHPDTLQSLNNLGRTLTYIGRYEEAADVLRKTVEKRRSVLGPKHPYTIGAIASLAYIDEVQGRFAQARSLLAEITQEEFLAAVSPDAAAALLARYGRCLQELGEPAAANVVLDLALQSFGNVKSATDITRGTVAAICSNYESQGDLARLARWRSALPPSVPATQPGR